jgi:ribosomal protein L7/L12
MDNIGENDCNSKELARLLVGSIQRLLNVGEWNNFARLQAVDDPFRFIEEVSKHADALEKEDESKGYVHLRITGITSEGSREKIPAIKALRQMFGWGLADSKHSFERLPGSGHPNAEASFSIVSPEFSTQESLEQSQLWKDFLTAKHLFHHDIVRLPAGTPASKPAEYRP